MPDTLKPCPFCGYRASLFASPDGGICVYCWKCGARTKTRFDTDTYSKPTNATQAVIDAWNRRVGHEPAGECVEHNRAERGSWCGEEGEKG